MSAIRMFGPAPADPAAIKTAGVEAWIETLYAAGAPVAGGLRVALDDSSRADLGGMATTAVAAASGAVAWPDSYKQGWITISNVRVPLPTPTDGLTLAAAVGDYYARCRQRARDLKDAILAAAADPAALAAIDISTGWPS